MRTFKELHLYQRDIKSQAYYWYKCDDCGFVGLALRQNIKDRGTRCDCDLRPFTSVWDHEEYPIWAGMLDRCRRPNNKSYPRYGGTGVTVSEEWNTFHTFYSDMGARPSKKHSIDRIDTALGYSKDNCRWATPQEQARNKTNNIWIELNGERRLLLDWAEILGLPYNTLKRRLYRTGKIT